VGSIPFFIYFDDKEENISGSIQTRTTHPFFYCYEKFSVRVQIKTHALPFFLKV